jgi:hypothetical protein
MTVARLPVKNVTTMRLPAHLPAAITRPRQLIEAVLAQSLLEMGAEGRTALAWDWALTGSRPSPVTLSLPPGRPPSREEILAESAARPEGSTASAGVPSDFCDELGEARRVLAWLARATDEIPVDAENRGRFIGARDDYARTDADIRQVRGNACRGLDAFDLPEHMELADAMNPWQWEAGWMNAAWLRGVRDLLDWVLGQRAASPLCGRTVDLPAMYDLTFEDTAADDVVLQGRPGGLPVDPAAFLPPQYGEAIQAAIRWLRGETTTPPADQYGCGAYAACPTASPAPGSAL